jgi:hypothetical protein
MHDSCCLIAHTCRDGQLTGSAVCLQGVGPKTAKQLVQSFGTVEQIFQQLASLSEAEQQNVRPTAWEGPCCAASPSAQISPFLVVHMLCTCLCCNAK